MLDLVAVPAGADASVIMTDRDSAERTEQRRDLHVKDVGQTALELPSFQEDLTAVLQAFGAVHDHVDFGVGSCTSDLPRHHLNVVHDACKDIHVHRAEGTSSSYIKNPKHCRCSEQNYFVMMLIFLNQCFSLEVCTRRFYVPLMFTGGLTASNQNISLYLPIILVDGKPAADWKLVHGLVSQIIHYDLK